MRCIDFENGLGTGVLPGDKIGSDGGGAFAKWWNLMRTSLLQMGTILRASTIDFRVRGGRGARRLVVELAKI
jgi:hypothetical protein